MGKPIKLDWDQLEAAFNDQNEELVYYLDLVTGHVHLDGEDEELADDEFDVRGATGDAPRNDGTRAYVEPPDTGTKIIWLKAFLKGGGVAASVVAEFESALRQDDPAPVIRDVLNQNPDVRDAWYVYRADRIRELIVTWLEQNAIVSADPCPWV